MSFYSILCLSRSNTFDEHCSKASTFAEMYSLLEDLYMFLSRSCKRDTVLRDDIKQVEERSETTKSLKDEMGVQK